MEGSVVDWMGVYILSPPYDRPKLQDCQNLDETSKYVLQQGKTPRGVSKYAYIKCIDSQPDIYSSKHAFLLETKKRAQSVLFHEKRFISVAQNKTEKKISTKTICASPISFEHHKKKSVDLLL